MPLQASEREDASEDEYEKAFGEGAPPPAQERDLVEDGSHEKDEEAAPQDDKAPAEREQAKERDYKAEYENVQRALRAEREQTKRMERAFNAAMARLEKPAAGAAPEAQKPPAADMPVLKDSYADPLEKLNDLEQLNRWLLAQRQADMQLRQAEQQQTAAQQKYKADVARYVEDVATDVLARVSSEERQHVNDAFRVVLQEHATVLMGAIYDPNRDRESQWAEAVQRANLALHRRADELLARGGDPVKELFGEAQRYGWARPAAQKQDQPTEPQRGDDGRFKARRQMNPSLSTRGRNGGAPADLKSLADAMDGLQDDEFDALFDKFTGFQR